MANWPGTTYTETPNHRNDSGIRSVLGGFSYPDRAWIVETEAPNILCAVCRIRKGIIIVTIHIDNEKFKDVVICAECYVILARKDVEMT